MAEIILTVEFTITAENEREAEKLLALWLIPQEDDDRLISWELSDESITL